MKRQFLSHCLLPWLVAVAALSLAGAGIAADKAKPADVDFFERRIRPLLVKHCYECHSADSQEVGGGLLLDSREASRRGGETGPAVIPGNVQGSLLISALEYQDFEMPPDGKLPDDVIADFRRWIATGAADPRASATSPTAPQTTEVPSPRLWSLAPVRQPQLPQVEDQAWPRSDVDRFVLSKLEQRGLQPLGDADSLTLLRRVHFDLIGLPPSPQQLAALQADGSADLAAVVDRLLASPRFGERWARHWLDVVRYAESAGNSRDVLMPYAWRYRDYVIDALNADVPYDRFITEQLAGDLLEADTPQQRDRLQVATGLLAVGSKSLNGGNLELDIVDDQIDVVSKAMLGLTVACARCHDHKFDPIPTADYYALAGIFKSTQTLYGGGTRRPKTTVERLKVYLLLGDAADETGNQIVEREKMIADLDKQRVRAARQVQRLQKKLPQDWKKRRKSLAAAAPDTAAPAAEDPAGDRGGKRQDEQFLKQLAEFERAQQKLRDLQMKLNEIKKTKLPEPQFAVGVRDAATIVDSAIHIRGEKDRLGDVVPRGFLSCIRLQDAPAVVGQSRASGRLELAQWLTHPEHPLTPRVIVNRIWQHLFGRGLVESVDNFGTSGLAPTHPELLDYLAHRFVHEHGWSIKSMIRDLVLTRTYQLASDYEQANYAADPANRLYWRMSRRRLEAEALRDSMLAASGNLVLDRPHGSPVAKIGEGEVGRGINTRPLSEPYPHRSVYLPMIRGMIPEFLKVFDLPEPSNPQGARDATNVPAQSLLLMNSPFVVEQAEGLARRILTAETQDPQRVRLAYRIGLSRSPDEREIARAVAYVSNMDHRLAQQDGEEADRRILCWTMLCQSLFASVEFRYVD